MSNRTPWKRFVGPKGLAALVAVAPAWACGPQVPSPPGDGPELVVLLVVDQLAPSLLTRYDTLFTDGFRRLLDDGYRFENATHDHASTETAPGHTTLGTGVYPTRHGIVGNTWFVRAGDEWRGVYSMSDDGSPIVGRNDMPGRSPRNAYRGGLADWVLAHDGESRVFSVSRKDRSAIGMAGQARGQVYWLADDAAEFVTSEFYRSSYPSWVRDFNRSVMPVVYADTLWESRVPAAARALSRPDTSRFEFDGVHVAFPHRPADTGDDVDASSLNSWRFEHTPFPDRAVVDFAMVGTEELGLGSRGHVDFLAVSLSQTDLVGHQFGPGSREQLDNLLRVDREIGRLLTFLDETVGEGRWVLALSADHGILEIPEILAEAGEPADRLTRAHRLQLLDQIAIGQAAAGSGPREEATRRAVATLPFVAQAYTVAEVESATPPDSFAALMGKSHSRERAVGLSERWGVYVRFHPQVLEWNSNRATHGSVYYYDRHVPLVFLGGRIQPGRTLDRAATVDVAPTLARLAGIPTPSDLDGRPLAALTSDR